MNLTRFADLIDKHMIWWIYRYIDITLHNKKLVDQAQHERYLDITRNHKDNMILFLDAEIVLRCLEEHVEKDKYNTVYPTHERIANLVECIKAELKHEEYMLKEPLMDVGKFKDWQDEQGAVTFNPIETYLTPRIFTDDIQKSAVRVVPKPPHS